MLENKTIGVVVPAYNEEHLIGRVIETIPDFVDELIIVDDKSTDATADVVFKYQKAQKSGANIHLIQLPRNRGQGFAVAKGYRAALDQKIDIVAVMDGDSQMDPDDLRAICLPVAQGKVDYTKGNRLFSGEAWNIIPRVRYLGNAFLSLLTKITSGYWHIADSQTGFTAISREAITLLPLDGLYPRFGYPNHLLTMCNVYNLRVVNVPITPIYGIGERSSMRLWRVIPTIFFLLIKNFFWRIKEKYIIRDFHPLVFFYALSFLLILGSAPLLARIIWITIITGNVPPINALAFMFSSITGLQSLLFAMWFDMDYNKRLK